MNSAAFFRRLIVAILALGIAFLYLFISFRGLTTQDGMEKAQLAREISRGSFKTKMIRPLAISQFNEAKNREGLLEEIAGADSYNAPLYPVLLGVVFKIVGADDFKKFKMSAQDKVYVLDRYIAGLSILFFFAGALIVYFLAARMFDQTLAGMVFVILITCEMFWNLTHTGMPNCLMFMLFMIGIYFTYIATFLSVDEKGNGLAYGVLAGLFFILLSLAHWMGVWVLLGFIVYSFIFLRPSGMIAAVTVLLAALFFAYPIYNNLQQTGNPFGIAFYTLYAGLGANEEFVMRAGDVGEVYLPIKDLTITFLRNLIQQVANVYEYMGLIIVAPLFFLSITHSYKKASVNNFKWGVLIIWFSASFGMSIYGLGDSSITSKQLHFLFAGVMSMYGLSILAILWDRFVNSKNLDPSYRNLHFIIIALLAMAPMFLNIPTAVYYGLVLKRNFPHWPPYYPSVLNSQLARAVAEDEYIFSDQPWAVAWYADRNAVWTPRDKPTFSDIERVSSKQNTPIVGIHISPTSIGDKPFYESYSAAGEMRGLALDGIVTATTDGKLGFGSILNASGHSDIKSKYPYISSLVGGMMVYYSKEMPDLRSKK